MKLLIAISTVVSITSSAWADGDFKLVAIGNSLTQHGPSPALMWNGNWGMAASSENADYVAQLCGQLSERAGRVVDARRVNLSGLEKDPTNFQWSLVPTSEAASSDLVVIELGDNATKTPRDQFASAYDRLVSTVKPTHGRLLCLSTWWRSTAVDQIIQRSCSAHGGAFVDIGNIHDKPGRAARDQLNPGVAAHPSDLGMSEIAARAVDVWCRGEDCR